MKSLGLRAAVLAIVAGAAVLSSACSTTWVVVPRPESGYSATDTLWGIRNGEDEVRVTFRFDTIMRVDTVTRLDTVRLAGTDTVTVLRRVLQIDTVAVPVAVTDTLVRVDTVRVAVRTPATQTVTRVDTIMRVDTVRIAETVVRVDTVRITENNVRVDTVEVEVPVTETVVRVDTVEVPVTETVVRTDTVRLTVTDTIQVAVTDTVIRTETVQVPGRRLLFVPPGHYPPDGQCRVWIHGVPPGQQARAAACDTLEGIPAGAFVLFGGDAWDYDWDWLAEAEADPGAVPPEILALKRRG